MTNRRQEEARSQRRYLAILFSDLSDSARLAASMEAEEFSDLLSHLWRAYEDIIPRHGGTIVQIRGDGLLASFGYPETHEDDGRRATEAALDLHEFVRRIPLDLSPRALPPLHLHTGIHSGLVLLAGGDDLHGRLDLLGNTVNVAARLSDVAQSDEILVSEETLGAESHFYETTPRRSLSLQGIIQPIAVYGILGRTGVGTRFQARSMRGLTSFIGRQTELQALKGSLYDIIKGKPQYVAIVAPAGMGKTRLVEEFLRGPANSDCQILRGYCESYLSAEPLQPFLQILRSLLGLDHAMTTARAAEVLEKALAEIDPDLLKYRLEFLRALSLDSVNSQLESRNVAPENTIAAICKLFDVLVASKPVVLFIDDWQWADIASRQVLEAIRRGDNRTLFVLVASRELGDGNVAVAGATILTLAPFSADEAEEIIRQLLPGSNPFTVTRIRELSGGNPLFIEELCHSVAHDSPDHHRIGRIHSGEAWLDKLIESRVERLKPEQIDLVRTAAVIGNVIPTWLLEKLTGCGESHPLVATLAAQDLIFPGEQPGTLRFKHGIARDVIYDSVGLRQRNALHKRIADTLREYGPSGMQEEAWELLAYHYGACGQVVEAAQYAEAAGDKAAAASALDRAQIQYAAALTALDPDASQENYERWISIVQRLALACVFDPSRDQLEFLRRAVVLATAHNDQRALARAEYWVGYVNYALGELARATRHLEAALAHASVVGDEPLAVQIRAVLGQACAAAGEYDKSLVLLDEAISIKRQFRKSGRLPVALAFSLACKASVLGDRGLFEQAHACFEEALAAVQNSGHEVEGSILCLESAVNLWQGRWEDARASAIKGQYVAERVKSLYLYAQSLSLCGYASWMTQRSQKSLQAIVDATSWLENRNRGLFVSLNHGWLADCLVENERWQQARRHAARALLRSRRHDPLGEAMAYRAMARASAAGHGRASPEKYLALAMKNALARGARHEIAVTQLCDAEIRVARGEHEHIAELLDQAESLFEAMGMSWHIEAARNLRRRSK
ncbi:AAA family ATPase [Bradyrhizobium sp. WSM 1738]|uniref:ATP-binding protein n=1 Tax=Bradyrhizobium hereditatis TaxID=2821405 RepID=UPI001CE35DE2|nr:AAA family ATPase [Bradyrhizobium hereditatis]MCA6118797.1 AAA family ATPase [Bradyrhizobium hereditatis]